MSVDLDANYSQASDVLAAAHAGVSRVIDGARRLGLERVGSAVTLFSHLPGARNSF